MHSTSYQHHTVLLSLFTGSLYCNHCWFAFVALASLTLNLIFIVFQGLDLPNERMPPRKDAVSTPDHDAPAAAAAAAAKNAS